MKAWQRLLETVSDCGEIRPDRTGVGTQSIFGLGAMFLNTPDSFPAVTTKRLAIKQCFGELASFLQGAETLDQFHANGCTVWDGNGNADHWKKRARFEGDLGPIYGSLWRKWPIATVREQPTPKLHEGLVPTFLGIANGQGSGYHPLSSVWHNMIDRCYNQKAMYYHLYGARGVFVDNSWLNFSTFVADAERLPGWNLKQANPDLYQLDKDILGDGFHYGPNHCSWVSGKENCSAKNTKRYTLEKEGVVYSFTNISEFCKEQGLRGLGGITDLWAPTAGKPNAGVRQGFRLLDIQDTKPKYIDQLRNLVEGIKKDPCSRRHIVSAFNPSELDRSCLPPCHVMFQCYVSMGKYLDILVVMRSVDLVLGAPFDIASYALLQQLIAKEVNLEPRRLLFNFSDAHIYRNHTDAVATILARVPKAPPKLILAPEATLFDFHPDMATLEGYESHDAVKAELNV